MTVGAAHTTRMFAAFLLCFCLLPAHSQEGRPAARTASDRVVFNRDIRPILSENCIRCHGPDLKARKADLRLDTREGVFAKLEEGRRVVVPGKPDQSELFRRVSSPDREEVMPPPKSGKKLTRHQVELIRRWIEQGAEWQGHWSFIPPQKPPLLRPRDPAWPRSAVDHFILARLEGEGLKPSPEADRHTLARRVTFDLTGLPPTPGEVDAFVDDASPDAYERLVDRLMASPRYGENMARFWLDLARYGDTHGLHLDNYREMWPYRDWVIRAFNENLPFDRFVREQVAGDLLPRATLDQQVASGFNRAHVTTNEGGSIEDEVYCRNVFDRVETFAQVFMALTFTCCRCHDHKYDPVTQKDYYGLFAFFNSLDGSELDGNRKDPAPVTKVPNPAEARELARLRDGAAAVEAKMDAAHPGLDAAQARWEREIAAKLERQWTTLDASGFKAVGEATLKEKDDRSVVLGRQRLELEVAARVAEVGIHAVRLEILPPDPAPEGNAAVAFSLGEVEADFVPADPAKTQRLKLRAAVAFQPDAAAKNLVDGKPETAWTGDARKAPAVVLLPSEPFGTKEGGELRLRLIHEGEQAKQAVPRFRVSVSTDGQLLRGVTPMQKGPWHLLGRFPAADGNAAYKAEFGPEKGVDLAKAYGELKWTQREDYVDGSENAFTAGVGASFVTRTLTSPSPRRITFSTVSDDAIQIWVNGAVVFARNAKRLYRKYDADKISVDLDAGENRLLIKFSNYGTGGSRFYWEVTDEDASDLLRDVAEVLAVPGEKRNGEQKSALRKRYRREHWPEWKPLSRQLAELRGQEKVLLDRIPTTLVFKERAQPKDAFILKRGEYDKKGEKVGRATPGALPPLPKDAPMNRLGVAEWLLQPAHPLTARVAVNRFWQQVFGLGLVKSSEDFGLQGEPPSHPELLDFLAAEFVEDGWDVKKLMRRLVTSSAYRQSSKVTPDLVRRDPDNRLLARGPRFRLDAETLRDQILFLSGLLVERVGGPSVKPPQPEGLWEAVGYTGSNTYRFQRDPEADKVFRRSMYIFWKRTSAPPQMTMFDAPSREACVARRERTNTPLQALLLMNEPQCFEAARHLAQLAIRDGGREPEERAAWMLRRCALRPVTPADVEDLVGLYRRQREAYGKDPEAARKAVATGDLPPDASIEPAELAAWTLVANLILNLDEVVTKR